MDYEEWIDLINYFCPIIDGNCYVTFDCNKCVIFKNFVDNLNSVFEKNLSST